MKAALASVLSIAGILIGLGTAGAAPSAEALTEAGMAETRWVLATLNGAPAENGVATVLSFQDGSRAGGNAGCNLFAATVDFGAEGALEIDEVFSTMMACEPARMAQEQAFFRTLSEVSAYRVEGGRLRLFDEEAAEIATLAPADR